MVPDHTLGTDGPMITYSFYSYAGHRWSLIIRWAQMVPDDIDWACMKHLMIAYCKASIALIWACHLLGAAYLELLNEPYSNKGKHPANEKRKVIVSKQIYYLF